MFSTLSYGFMTKKYVSVVVEYNEDGNKIPKKIYLDDVGYNIDCVLERKNSASLKVGGIGERFTIKIGLNKTFLFFEKETEKWFVELKN